MGSHRGGLTSLEEKPGHYYCNGQNIADIFKQESNMM